MQRPTGRTILTATARERDDPRSRGGTQASGDLPASPQIALHDVHQQPIGVLLWFEWLISAAG
jgi:hypothetical protein